MKKSHTAGWVSDSPTLAILAELFRQISGGRINKQKPQSFLHNGTIFQNEDAARTILGEDILFPDEVAKVRGLSYSEEQLKQLAATLPPEEVLRPLKKSSYALMPAPPMAMSLLKVRELEPNFFYYSKSGGWYTDQKFAENDRTACGWLAVRKGIVPDSTNKEWDEQRRLLADEERVPNAAELAWFITTYYEVRGVRLFKGLYARTSSMVSGDFRVSLGYSNSRELSVVCWQDGHRSGYIGLASARKF